MNVTQNVKISSQIYTSLSELKINGEIETMCNISHVWIKKNSYGLSLSCYQIKYIPRIEELDIDFFDIKKQISNNQNQPKEIINIPKKEIVNAKIIDTPTINVKPMMMLSSSILNDAITKLNKVKN